MEIKNGIPVSPGIVIARCCVVETEEFKVQRRVLESSQIGDEIKKAENSFRVASEQLAKVGSDHDRADTGIKDIFAVHISFLRDKSLIAKVTNKIREASVTAEYAVSEVFREITVALLRSNDSYIRERVGDIHDIEKRLLRVLMAKESYNLGSIDYECIIIANDLSPTQTASLNLEYIKGFATNVGGRTSHTAIVARSLGIPAIVAIEDITSSANDGDIVILDGFKGTVILRPDDDTIREYHRYSDDFIAIEHKLEAIRDLPAETKDGVRITLTGNMELPLEAQIIMEKGGDGVGLYRTEFLYLQSKKEPTEEEHYQAYVDIANRLNGKPLVIRTMDLGADKVTYDGRFAEEANPVLGFKSIRYCLNSKNLPMFKTQLRAILRASAVGDIKMMFPMITTIDEIRHAKMIVRDVMEDLADDGYDYDHNIQMGIMIETPSAALTAGMLANESDFFSVGTNDLIQYTLAVDRANEKLAALYSPGQPAILRLLRTVLKEAGKANIPVSVCGEMASEPEFVPLLLGMGVRKLSVAAPRIPEIKLVIRNLEIKTCKEVARRVRLMETRRAVVNYLRDTLMTIMPEVR